MTLLILSVGLLTLHTHWSWTQVDIDLTDLGTALSRVMEEELGESGNVARAAAEVQDAMHVPDHAVAILDTDGNPIAGEWHGFEYHRQIGGADDAAPHFLTVTQHGHAWRLLTRRQTSRTGDFVVLVGETLDGLQRQHRLLLQAIVIATPLLVLLSGALCWWVASAALRPVTLLAAQAEAITGRSNVGILRRP